MFNGDRLAFVKGYKLKTSLCSPGLALADTTLGIA
jgi:hypothetical protein